MTPGTASALYAGEVVHRRFRPFGHKFRYRIFSLLIDIDEVSAIAAASRIFRHNRFGLFSFHDRDHGPRDGSPLRPWIAERLAARGIDIGRGAVRILCFPRILGYVFNPLSVWFVHDEAGHVRAVLYEVTNTFGESLSYLIEAGEGAGPGTVLEQTCTKQLHVSPFMPLSGGYRFRIRVPDETYAIAIRYAAGEGELLFAAQTGTRRPLSDQALLRAFVAYPLMTLKVIGAIHFEALRLWLKGARYGRKPARPDGAILPARVKARTAH